LGSTGKKRGRPLGGIKDQPRLSREIQRGVRGGADPLHECCFGKEEKGGHRGQVGFIGGEGGKRGKKRAMGGKRGLWQIKVQEKKDGFGSWGKGKGEKLTVGSSPGRGGGCSKWSEKRMFFPKKPEGGG